MRNLVFSEILGGSAVERSVVFDESKQLQASETAGGGTTKACMVK